MFPAVLNIPRSTLQEPNTAEFLESDGKQIFGERRVMSLFVKMSPGEIPYFRFNIGDRATTWILPIYLRTIVKKKE